MEHLFTLFRQICTWSIPLIGSEFGYVVDYKTNIQNLGEKVEKLNKMRVDVKELVEAARGRSGFSIKQAVQSWQDEGERIVNEAMALKDEAEEINSWYKGWCCTFIRHHSSKEADKLIGKLKDLLNEGKSFTTTDAVSIPPPPPNMESMLTGRHFWEFASREYTTKQIIEALKNEKIEVIGVYGMPGIGKTLLMKEVGKQAEREKLFNKVLMVTVSQNPLLKSIQGGIAEKLGLTLKEDDESVRATRLSTRLEAEKPVLIILDDVWETLDLAEVGIPYRVCKIVLTTRSLDVCNQMDVQQAIEVGILSKQDSWSLFQDAAGATAESPDFEKIARDVVQECEGLPLAITIIGKTLRNKVRPVWEGVAQQLRKSDFYGMQSVNSKIKLSYDYLPKKDIKRCFLICCLFPEDYKFTYHDLLMYAIGDGLLRDYSTLEEARGTLCVMVDMLVSSSLLIKDDGVDEILMMHDIVRDAAVSIASEKSNRFIVKAGLGLTQWPDVKNIKTCLHMSLVRHNISKFPNQPECPQLLTLSLSDSSSHVRLRHEFLERLKFPLSLSDSSSFERLLPDSFFERMTFLVTLDLNRTGITWLPPSLSCLVNLRILLLEYNCLSEVSIVGKLKKLEILALNDNWIKRLPREIGGLTNLKFLDLSENYYLKSIPQNVLSSLSRLEEFYMTSWDLMPLEGYVWKPILTELASLNCLTRLSLRVNGKCLLDEISMMHWEKLTNFHIRQGESGEYWGNEFSKTMSLVDPSGPLSNWVKVLLKRTEELNLCICSDVKSFVQLVPGGFNNLKILRIKKCHEMEYFINVVEQPPLEAAFNSLEQLFIEDMVSLVAINHGPTLPKGFLKNLKVLYISGCNKLKLVFPMKLVRGLLQLQQLTVIECNEMEEIIGSEEGEEDREEDKMLLPQLTSLRLYDLPNLSSFYQRGLLFNWPALDDLQVRKCPNLKSLPLGPQSAPKLKVIHGDSVEWFETFAWDDESLKARLQPLFEEDYIYNLWSSPQI